jgi:phage terminase large subunit-like protein
MSSTSVSLEQASLAERLALNPAERAKFLSALSEDERRVLEYNWKFWARPKQLAPSWDWSFWLILAGRGFGKTRIGAEWIIERARQGVHGMRIALVAETAADARDVMVEGETGILTISPPWFRPKYEPSKRRLTWPNGVRATTFSAEEPDQLRGPQHHYAWGDEPAKWRYADTWDQLLMGLRLGHHPQAVLTTTPRPTPLIKSWVADAMGPNPTFALTKGSTYENRGNLAPRFLDTILRKFEGTRLGRQELEAELLDDAPGALWKRADHIEQHRVSTAPEFVRIVVAVDPSVSSDSPNAETGIVAAGLGKDGHGYVLADGSLERPTPEKWGSETVALYSKLQADRVVAEVNNGGDLVASNIRVADPSVPVKKVHAARGKQTRAEPISSLYEQGRVHHVGCFPLLEDQMCQWEPGVSTWSPNRIDALVWALTELMLGRHDEDSGNATLIKRRR